MEPRGRSCPIRGSEYLAEPEDGSTWGGQKLLFGRTPLSGMWLEEKHPRTWGPYYHLTFSSWVWLSAPGPLEEPFLSGFWNLPIHLNLSAPCWSRPLSVCFLNDSLSPPLSFSPPLYPPSSPTSACLATSTSPFTCLSLPILPSPCGQGSDPPGCAPLPPQVSARSPRAAQVSGGLRGGGVPPSRLGCSSPAPAGSLFKTSPRRRDCAAGAGRHPEPRGGHNDSPATYADTTGGLSTQTRARTHTVLHNRSPASGARTDAEPTLDSRQQARSRKQPQAPARTECPRHPRHSNTPPASRWGPPGEAPAPSASAGLPGRALAPRLALLPLLLAPCSAQGPLRRMGPAGGGSALPCSTPGPGGVRAQSQPARPPSLCPAPRKPRPLETPPLAAKLCPSRRSPALSQETTPLIEPRPPLCFRNALSQLLA